MTALTALLAVPWLAGCGWLAGPQTRSVLVENPTDPPVTKAEQQRRLAVLFHGMPVDLTLNADGSLRVEVTLRACFDRGKAVVKPVLAAVLDRVAADQRHEGMRLRIAAPTDPGAKGLRLAIERAASMRGYLVAHGVAESRFSIAALARGRGVVIDIDDD